jgi:hypothetical protein
VDYPEKRQKLVFLRVFITDAFRASPVMPRKNATYGAAAAVSVEWAKSHGVWTPG